MRWTQATDGSFVNLAHAKRMVLVDGNEYAVELVTGEVFRVASFRSPVSAQEMWEFVQWESEGRS